MTLNDGSRLEALSGAALRGEPEVGDHCDVILVADEPGSHRNALTGVKLAASRGAALGMHGDFHDVRDPTTAMSTWRFSTASVESVRWPAPDMTVICDLNILIDIERCVRRRDAVKWSQLLDSLTWLKCCDMLPGFGIAESGFSERGDERRDSLRALMGAVFDAYEIGSVDDVHDRFMDRLANVAEAEESRSQVGATRSILPLLNYVGVLLAAKQYEGLRNRPFNSQERTNAWLAWIDAVDADDVRVSAYCLIAVTALLLGASDDSSGAAALLKLSRSPAQNDLAGAAWDLTYLMIRDLAAAGQLEDTGDRPVVFLTGDKALRMLSTSASMRTLLITGAMPIATVGSDIRYSSKLTDRDVSRIERRWASLRTNQTGRRLRDLGEGRIPSHHSLVKRAHKLEDDLGFVPSRFESVD